MDGVGMMYLTPSREQNKIATHTCHGIEHETNLAMSRESQDCGQQGSQHSRDANEHGWLSFVLRQLIDVSQASSYQMDGCVSRFLFVESISESSFCISRTWPQNDCIR
jgi:hypothetical protein